MGEAVRGVERLTKPFPRLQVQRLMDVPNDSLQNFPGVCRGPGLAVVGDFGGFVDVSRGEVDVGGEFPEEASANLQAAQPSRQHFLSGSERRQRNFDDQVKPPDMSRVNPVQVVTNPDRRDRIGFEEAVGPPFEGVVMVHGHEREEIGPREGILNFVEQQEAVRGLRQDPLAEEVTLQPPPTSNCLPVVVFGADFKQPGFDMLGEGPRQFGLPGTRWAIEQDIGPRFPAFHGLADIPDQQAEVGVVGEILQRQGWGRRLGEVRRQYPLHPTFSLPEGLVEAFQRLDIN